MSRTKAETALGVTMPIRSANSEDIPDILAIWNPIIRDSLTTFTTVEKTPADIEQMLARAASEHRPFLISEQAGQTVGFATYSAFRSGPGYAYTMEISINLAESARGAGIGRKLLTEMEKTARENEIHSLIAGVSGANLSGIAFHKACGYTQAAILTEVGYKQDQRLDLVLLQKKL